MINSMVVEDSIRDSVTLFIILAACPVFLLSGACNIKVHRSVDGHAGVDVHAKLFLNMRHQSVLMCR